jgi:hypothetical protein
MITNFEEITKDLTAQDRIMTLLLMKGFANRTIDNPITEPQIITAVNEHLKSKNVDCKKLTGSRLRKHVNFIRVNSLQPLIATSKGYFLSENIETIESQIKSLRERANSIHSCADGLLKLLMQIKNT